ncbi:class I SAM-dependent methyltransferase [Candidatus Harpocratesius sp.]
MEHQRNKNAHNPFSDQKNAENYESFYLTTVGHTYDRLEKEAVVSLLKQYSGDSKQSLLEIGCGTGHWTTYFHSLGYQSFGIDSSETMLQIARKNSHEEILYIKADAENFSINPPFPPEFDIIAFITSLEFMNSPFKIIKHALRYLRKNGLLLLGLLNADSYLGRQRKKEPSIYTNAHFFTESELITIKKALESYLGITIDEFKIQHCAFAKPSEIEEGKAEQIEKEGKKMNQKNGNFIAAIFKI